MSEIRLHWSFGEPREENGGLAVDFYYQTGKHSTLRFDWPTRRFTGAGDLAFHGSGRPGWRGGFDRHAMETGRTLYSLLGGDAQAALIRTFANLSDDDSDRALVLQFPSPSRSNQEKCLALEDLPWELLHDGESYISWRYSLQIVRSHSKDHESTPNRRIDVYTWGVLLATPFVYAEQTQLANAQLTDLPRGREEVETLRSLQSVTGGLIKVTPSPTRRRPGGVKTFAEFESALRSTHGGSRPVVHFIGHGVMVDGEPCLVFEDADGGPDYVSVSRMRSVLLGLRELDPRRSLPSVLFLNACGSSSRGRYSAGFASGLHDLGLCVLGYQAEIEDDDKPILAARRFYQSLCMDQSLQTPHLNPTVVGAVESARRALRGPESEAAPLWGRFRAYIPSGIEFAPRGRGFVERSVQSLYTRFAEWMNPNDYTDHLSIGFLIAIFAGILLGFLNLAFVLPENVMPRHLTYTEITSELVRIFLIGPLSFLAAALFAAWQTRRNHRKIQSRAEMGAAPPPDAFAPVTLPIALGAGAAFSALFSYSFSRLDLLISQMVALADLTHVSASVFWFSLVGALGLANAAWLILCSFYHVNRHESLHSYKSFYWIALGHLALASLVIALIAIEKDVFHYRKLGWLGGAMLIIAMFNIGLVKIVKETAWRASKKRMPLVAFSWRKFWPLIGGAALVVICYVWLEQSARFEPHVIREAMIERKEQGLDSSRRIEQILERALRQRAVTEMPAAVREAAPGDWLLSVAAADSMLFQSQLAQTEQQKQAMLAECLDKLEAAIELNPELEVRDYVENISAFVAILRADFMDRPELKRNAYEYAIEMAERAVDNDVRNFAYLDTLARAEAKLSVLNRDRELLQRAYDHARQAEWSAFFLRSPRAEAVRSSIRALVDYIREQLDQLENSGLEVSP